MDTINNPAKTVQVISGTILKVNQLTFKKGERAGQPVGTTNLTILTEDQTVKTVKVNNEAVKGFGLSFGQYIEVEFAEYIVGSTQYLSSNGDVKIFGVDDEGNPKGDYVKGDSIIRAASINTDGMSLNMALAMQKELARAQVAQMQAPTNIPTFNEEGI